MTYAKASGWASNKPSLGSDRWRFKIHAGDIFAPVACFTFDAGARQIRAPIDIQRAGLRVLNRSNAKRLT